MNKYKFIPLASAIFAIFLVVVGVAYARSGNTITIEGDYIEASEEAQEFIQGLVSDSFGFPSLPSLGAVGEACCKFINNHVFYQDGYYASSTAGYALGTYNAATTSGPLLTDGRWSRMVSVDLSATSSAVALNPEGETIWVYDATIRVQTATTSAIAYQMGTTTVNGIDQGATCGATDACALATAGHASILDTGTEAVPTLLDTFFKDDNQGTDTRDGSGTRFVVPVLAGEYFSCNASTTPVANNQTGGQAVQCQFWYYVIED